MKPTNTRKAKTHRSRQILKPLKSGGLQLPHEIPDDFNTMFEAEIESLFSGSVARLHPGSAPGR